jgi:hypothetical protein
MQTSKCLRGRFLLASAVVYYGLAIGAAIGLLRLI